MEQVMLELTPPSLENTPPVLVGIEVDEQQENPGQFVVNPLPLNEEFNPPVSSTPERERENTSEKRERKRKRLQAQKRELREENQKLKKQLADMRKVMERARKSEVRAKERVQMSEKFKPKGKKKVATQREQAVVSFFTRDENSRLLPGKKDTITKNKVKYQRRVLTKPLKELHTLYNSEMERSLHLSYRQFTRKQPSM